ncbi:MAG: MATE family efflux transporter [Bacillales bacterium]|nr:MATE family efflux transporter [Bacillales bacterium]
MKNRDLMSKGNPFKAVIVFSIPSIIGMLVNSIYNIVDKMFIGNYVSPVALAGLQVVNPITILWFGVLVVFGIGGSSYASNKLGEKKDEEANKVFNNAIVLSTITSLVFMVLFYIFYDPLLKLGGVLPENYTYAKEYFLIYISGFFFQSLAYLFMMSIRSEGRPAFAMISQVTGFVVNIVFDYLFIVVFHMGVKGAAIATVMGNIANFMVGLYFYFFSKKNYFKISLKDMKLNKEYVSQILSIGVSSMVLNFCTAISVFVFNNVLKKYDNALSILGILSSLGTLCFMPLVGIRQGLLPLFSYNYGDKNNKRIFKLYNAGAFYGILYGVIISLIMSLFPAFFINLFVENAETAIISEAVRISRFYYAGVILIAVNMNTSALYQSTRQKVKAILLSMMRQFLFLIPSIYILDAIFMSEGVWAATPVSDFLSALISFLFFITTYIVFKKTGYLSLRDMKNNKKSEEDLVDCRNYS